MTGYIKLHRKVWNSAIYSDPNMLKLWVHCLMKATHTEHDQLVGNTIVKLIPGEFVTGRNALSDEYNKGASLAKKVKPLSLWRWMQTLEKMEMLNIKTTNKYSVISIVNWCEYQQNEQQVNNKRTTNDQQMITNKNGNKGMKEKKETSSPKFSTSDLENSNLLFQKMLDNNPDIKEPNLEKWADDFRLIRERDKKTDVQIKYLIKWTQADEFWRTNILSPGKLRKQWDQLVAKAKADDERKKRDIYNKPLEQHVTSTKPKSKPLTQEEYLRSE